MTPGRYTAVVLAGDRGPADPIATATGAPCKALSPVGGQPLLARVLDTLRATPAIEAIVVVGPADTIVAAEPALAQMLADHTIHWVAPADSPAASAVRGLAHVADDRPVLLTTADHALLEPRMIEELLADPSGDIGVGLVEYAAVRQAYPDNRRTAIRLGPGSGYCGCNLFALHTLAARRLVATWQRVERERKHPARVVAGMLGPLAVLRYLLGRLTLVQAFDKLSRRVELNIRPVLLSQPQAAVDVDSLADLALVESILARRPVPDRSP